MAAESLAAMTGVAELECGFLFPRFSDIKQVSARLMAAAAHHMVRSRLGSLPADFDAVVASTGGVRLPGGASSASNLAHWEAYATAHMYDPNSAKL